MEYDNTNRGALWKVKEDAPYDVIMQGKINMNGFDRNCILIKRKNAQGQDTFEVFESIGNVKKISQEEKQNEKAPDGKGVVEIRKIDTTMGIAFWRKQKKDGEGFLSVSLSEYKVDDKVEKDIKAIKNAFPDSKVLTDDLPTDNEF
tara:strand:+ start:594 stop:1031 length:438 start_codon:yes stop_codon:yes gene_type:complete